MYKIERRHRNVFMYMSYSYTYVCIYLDRNEYRGMHVYVYIYIHEPISGHVLVWVPGPFQISCCGWYHHNYSVLC